MKTWKILIPPILKREKACPEENTKGVVALPLSRGKPMGLQEQGQRQLNGRGQGWGKMKEGCWASWIPQDRTRDLHDCELVLFLKEREECTKQDSEFLRTALPLLGARLFLPQLPRVGPPLRFCGSGRSHTVP